ncbi:uncharacterized protein LOC127855443 [Dreissena polymorpha]|uniref:uncharacterized protein LOC127855443 n=1 Tax=Dreissena polymorpha TaxID=45954 RepID=UPI00226466DE|nr:uncharacterized protein LOC127855443 [Dreissena polymorpha]
MNSQRHLKSKVFYEDGHVHKVQTSSIDENTSHLYIRATVIPSFPTADKKKSPDYRPWVLLSKVTGCVHSATCNCPAGEGESCNHIGALLYAVKDISNKVQDGKHSSTSQKCKWSNPRKRKLSPKKSQSVIFKKHKFESSLRKPVSGLFVKENATFTESTVNIQRLRNRLTEKSLNVGWLQNFPVHKEPEPLIPTIHKVEFMYRDSVNLESPECCTVFEAHFRNINISADDCQAVETMTRGQSSQPWKVARRERITSSFFGKVFKRKTDTKPDNLLKEMLYSDFSNKSTAYGKKHEKPARKMYVWKMNTVHKGLKVTECGLLVNQRYPHLGSSPDGLVYCPHCEESHGLVEIKCPASMKWRMITPEECCNDKDFFCSLVDGKVVLKQNHLYYYQVQGQMAVSGRRWCDFVVWTCAGLSVERITFNNKLWMQMQARLDDFYIKSFIPELYSLRVYRNVPLI